MSSHLFSLLCLYFSVFHDAKPEWEWTNLLLPERTEWAAAIRCAHQRWRQRWRYMVEEKWGREGEGCIWTTVIGSLREGDSGWYRKVNNGDEWGTGKERVQIVGWVYRMGGDEATWENAKRKTRGGDEGMRGWDANNGEMSIEERKQAEDADKRGKDWLKRQEFRKTGN